MSTVTENNKRIAKNTIMLYIRQLLILVISLFTSRVILKALGVNDFGINNVVAGVVAMMTTVNSAMGVATTRYITFELGKGEKNFERLHKTFCISFTTYVVLSVIFVVLAETLGLWFLNTQLVIPEDRMVAANWIYQFSIITVVNTLMANPYNAVILAHEKMDTYAYVSILEAVLKLVIVYLLYISPVDKLIMYGFLFMLQALVIRMVYRVYCYRKFPESHYKIYKDPALLKKLFAYSGWNLFGAIAQMVKGQGLNILLNMFFSPAVNAARGIAYQVNNAIYQFSSNFYSAVRPQVTKYYSKQEYDNMYILVCRASRMSFYLLLILSLPIIIETPFIINLWLGQVPDYVVGFVRIIIAISAVEAMQHPVTSVCHATGRVALFQFVVSTTIILIVPISWFFLKQGYSPYIVFYVSLVLNTIALFLRLVLVKRLVKFPLKNYIVNVIVRNLLVAIVSGIIPVLLYKTLAESIHSVCIVVVVTLICTIVSVFYIGMLKDERSSVLKLIRKKIQR